MSLIAHSPDQYEYKSSQSILAWARILRLGLLIAAMLVLCCFSLISPSPLLAVTSNESKLTLPSRLHTNPNSKDSPIYWSVGGSLHRTTLVPTIQRALQSFIASRQQPIAAVVLADVATGQILAMVEGRSPARWGASLPTYLYPGFPAASLFKLVTTAAAFEALGIGPKKSLPLLGSCAEVGAAGHWLRSPRRRKNRMNFERAFALSCNSFYAKVSVKHVGLGLIDEYAKRFRWGRSLPADIKVPKSPIRLPRAGSSNIQTIGRFAAGFGPVGISPLHAAWIILMIASEGRNRRISLLKDSQEPAEGLRVPLIKADTARKIRAVSRKTVRYGTAKSAFTKRYYRRIRHKVGGKTGTLSTRSPSGQITWFIGMMPYNRPRVVVAAMVLNDRKLWHIRGPDLAARALLEWERWQRKVTAKKRRS